jgi:serine/threonine protein phosphatase PrpC
VSLNVRYAAGSDVGLRRDGNEDSAYAGPRLLAVADGMGGAAAGEVASSVTIARLAELDDDAPGTDLLAALREKAEAANDELHEIVEENNALEGMGTTMTALLWDGGRLGLAHIGDSRAYLFRDGELHRITRDHTWVQDLIVEGRLSPDEASTHPQRSLLTHALDGRSEPHLDLTLREVRAGDRYLLCSDGLSGVVSEETLAETLAATDPQVAVDRLIDLALRGGGPDNVTVVVADLVDGPPKAAAPAVVGAAATRQTVTRRTDSAAARAALATKTAPAAPAEKEPEPTKKPRRRWRRIAIVSAIIVVLLAGGAAGAWAYVRSQYYVGTQGGQVVIYRGVSGSVAGLSLHHVSARTDLPISALPAFDQDRVQDGIPASSRNAAKHVVDRLRRGACPNVPLHPISTAPTPAPASPPPRVLPTPTARPAQAPAARPTPTPIPSVPPWCTGPTS